MLEGLLKIPLLIGLDALGRVVGPGRGGGQNDQHRQETGNHRFAGDRQQQFGHQADDGQGQGPLVAVFPDLLAARGNRLGFHGVADFIVVDGVQVHVPGHGAHVGAAGEHGHFLEGVFVQPGEHDLAAAVLLEPAGRLGDGHAVIAAHADAEEFDRLLLERFGRFQRIPVAGILSVGNQDHGFVRGAFGIEAACGRLHSAGDIGAAHGQVVGRQGTQKKVESVIIQGQRALQKGRAGKGHQSHAISLEHGQQIEDLAFGALQPGRANVGGGHGAGAIQGDDQIHPALMDFLPAVAVFGPGQGEGGKKDGPGQKGGLDPAPAGGLARRDGRQAVVGSKTVQDALAPPQAIEDDQQQ
ncbi:hypothetical protein DESC_720149 [Desulfosarcina cetonica]|nr:hypothetical protein DESC_720149 [Desulfosarcina cetonica]